MATGRAKVVELQPTAFTEIRVASVHSAGQRLSGSRNEVWLCPAYSGTDTAMLYVKPFLSTRQVVAELVGSQVGLCLGLPCPAPFLVTVAPHHVGKPRGQARLTFGCQQVGPTGTVYPVRNLALMVEMLRKTKHSEATVVLDEWIANSVRGAGDIVFDTQKAVWLIDHEGAFEPSVRPDEAVTNWLAGQLIAGLTRSQRTEFLARLHAKLRPVMGARLGRMPPELRQIERGPETYRAVLEFLEARLSYLGALLSARVVPEQMTLDNLTPESDDPERAADV